MDNREEEGASGCLPDVPRVLPARDGQADTMLVCDGPGVAHEECGHWYSPAAVCKIIAAERARCTRIIQRNQIRNGHHYLTDHEHEETIGHYNTGMIAEITRGQATKGGYFVGQRVLVGSREIGTVDSPLGHPPSKFGIWVYVPSLGYASDFSLASIEPLPNGQL